MAKHALNWLKIWYLDHDLTFSYSIDPKKKEVSRFGKF